MISGALTIQCGGRCDLRVGPNITILHSTCLVGVLIEMVACRILRVRNVYILYADSHGKHGNKATK